MGSNSEMKYFHTKIFMILLEKLCSYRIILRFCCCGGGGGVFVFVLFCVLFFLFACFDVCV